MRDSEKSLERTADKIAVFEDKKIRRALHKGGWYFSIIDIIRILTESSDPSRYWPELKKKLLVDEGVSQLLDKIEQLKLESGDGKNTKRTRPIQKPSFALSNPFPLPKQSLSRDGLPKLGMSVSKKSKTPNWLPSALVRSIKLKGIAMSGSKNECEGLRSVKNLPMNGIKEESNFSENMRF